MKIIYGDDYPGSWGPANAVNSNAALRNVVDVIGGHYTCGYLSAQTTCTVPSNASSSGKTLWSSENGSQDYNGGAKPLARGMGAGISSDAFHMVAPAPDGLRAGHAMKRAIETAGLSPKDIDHVNAHATSTSIGDVAEANAIRSAGVEHAAVYAPKSALGHSIGAVGALESILTVLALRDGVIPPTLNYETPDPEIDLDVVAGEPRYGDYQYAINNSFGFGGHNVALAFGRY
jgi:3-oxoacyl-(acyl-carrier-protein) synthase